MTKARTFVEQVYIPDLLAVAPFYTEWAGYGEGLGNFMSYGEFPDEAGNFFLPQGLILNRDLSTVQPFDQAKITEYVTHSWYEYGAGDQAAMHPWDGETKPNYTGPKPPYDFLQTDGKYTWLKAPRYDDKAMEVGPLARMLVAYVSGHQRVKEVVDLVLGKLGVGPEALFSTLGRTAARGIETLVVAEQLVPWLDKLIDHIGQGDLKIHNGEQLGSGHLAQGGPGLGDPRSAARRAGALDPDRRRQDRQLPVRGALDLERLAARCQRPARRLRGRPDRHAGRRPGAAAGDPAHGPLLRPVHGLRRACGRRPGPGGDPHRARRLDVTGGGRQRCSLPVGIS